MLMNTYQGHIILYKTLEGLTESYVITNPSPPATKFDCSNQMCGNITAWGMDVEQDRPFRFGPPYTLVLQVWRPSPTVDDFTGTGCNSLVETTGSPLFL